MQSIQTELTKLLKIDFPIIMAPLFLVTNEKMMIDAMNTGIAACMPALNWSTVEKMKKGIREIQTNTEKGALGINLIVNNYNSKYLEQLQACIDLKVDFIITSFGNPEKVISACKKTGIKVFCKVRDEKFAKKVTSLGADAIIAVNKEAGGHCGSLLAKDLIPLLKKSTAIPIISAGGVGDGETLYNRLKEDKADGCSIGSAFIASKESNVSKEYKTACIQYADKDIVMSSKICGTPITVINTPYLKRIGTKQNWLVRLLIKNKIFQQRIKKHTFLKGMKALDVAAKGISYKNIWIAGPSIKNTFSIRTTKDIIYSFINTYNKIEKGKKMFSRSISRES